MEALLILFALFSSVVAILAFGSALVDRLVILKLLAKRHDDGTLHATPPIVNAADGRPSPKRLPQKSSGRGSKKKRSQQDRRR